jgi:hypothetical protein
MPNTSGAFHPFAAQATVPLTQAKALSCTCMLVWEEAGQQPLRLSLRLVSCVNQTAPLDCCPLPADLWELVCETVLMVQACVQAGQSTQCFWRGSFEIRHMHASLHARPSSSHLMATIVSHFMTLCLLAAAD